MVGLEPECHLWFMGTDEPAALVDVSVYGGADADAYRALTGKASAAGGGTGVTAGPDLRGNTRPHRMGLEWDNSDFGGSLWIED